MMKYLAPHDKLSVILFIVQCASLKACIGNLLVKNTINLVWFNYVLFK